MAEPPAAAFRRVLFHGDLRPELAAWLTANAIRAEPFGAHTWSLAADEVGLLLGGPDLAAALAFPPPPGLGQAADRVGLLQLGESLAGLDPFWEARLVFSLPEDALEPHRARALLASFRILEERARAARDRRALVVRTSEAQALVEIGIALSAETDREKLLETILTRARKLTAADAGSLYLVTPPDSPDSLRFVLAQNDSVRFEFREAVLPLEHPSIAGFVARTGEVVQVAEAREIPAGAPYGFDAEFDERIGLSHALHPGRADGDARRAHDRRAAAHQPQDASSCRTRRRPGSSRPRSFPSRTATARSRARSRRRRRSRWRTGG